MITKPKEEKRKCDSCGYDTLHKFMFIKNACQIWECQVCNTGHAEFCTFDPESYYTEDYFNGTYSDGYSNYLETEEALNAEFSKTLQVIKKIKPKGGKLLEIGCAYGFFLKLASQLYDVYGVEISANAVTDCHRRGLNQVYPGMLTPEVMNDIGQYDILVMLDVIEHLENPKNVLEIATSQLKSGGIFILTTGDYSSMLARIFKSNWRLMTPPQHMWFFSVEGIQKLAKSLGFEVISISHPWKFVPLSLIFYQIMRILGFQPRNYKFISNKLFMPINMFDAMQVILYKK